MKSCSSSPCSSSSPLGKPLPAIGFNFLFRRNGTRYDMRKPIGQESEEAKIEIYIASLGFATRFSSQRESSRAQQMQGIN